MAGGGGGGGGVGSYSPLTGFVFIFNLIVGAGALTIPHAFARVGLVYGAVALAALAGTSFMTATFMVEAIAGVNALEAPRPATALDGGDHDDDDAPTTEFMPLMVPTPQQEPPTAANGSDDDRLEKQKAARSPTLVFDLTRKVELAQMAHALFNHHGIVAFYACVTVYLYGDLAIYAVAVPKSVRELVCPRPSSRVEVWACTERLDSRELYRILVVIFGVVLGPFAFGHVQKTRALQLITTVVRHVSFGLMIFLALLGILRGQGRAVDEVLAYEHPANLATFFGVCIYSFMCHHSIPGLIAPITDKSKVAQVIGWAFAAVLSVYLILSFSATFRFLPDDIDDVYTLNFQNYPVRAVAYFLSLFPVCTLSANFPLICITLRENLRTLAHNVSSDGNHSGAHAHDAAPAAGVGAFVKRHVYALVALVPPLVVAFFTEDVSMLVGFTGAYAGLGIQWVVPAALVYSLRRRLAREPIAGPPKGGARPPSRRANPFASPFAHPAWLVLTFGLSVLAIVVITALHVR